MKIRPHRSSRRSLRVTWIPFRERRAGRTRPARRGRERSVAVLVEARLDARHDTLERLLGGHPVQDRLLLSAAQLAPVLAAHGQGGTRMRAVEDGAQERATPFIDGVVL